uniref:Tesmin/TSO1-like CXC domain-containing protein n=1 Tax=Ditylenchus dipsaci TaxID=166011 RepID=A0A915CS28_9BILA
MLSLTHPEISVPAYEQAFEECTTIPSATEKCFQQVRTLLKDGISDLSCINTCQIVDIQKADAQCFSSVSLLEWSEVTSSTNQKDDSSQRRRKSTGNLHSLQKDSQLQARSLTPQVLKSALDFRQESNLLPRVLEGGLECKFQGSSPIVRELKRGSPYKVHHFHHLHSCYYYGMLSVDTKELADTMFAYKANFFGGEIVVDQNTHCLKDISLLKVSGSRNTAFLLDSTATKVTWFNLLETKARDVKIEAGNGVELECGSSCCNCVKPGHMSCECFQPRNGGGGGCRCYKCQETVHMSREYSQGQR